jgi:hypothetical protein
VKATSSETKLGPSVRRVDGMLFARPMVRALLGTWGVTKTETRRPIVPAPGHRWNHLGGARFCAGEHPKSDACISHSFELGYRVGPGSRLAVRETWWDHGFWDGHEDEAAMTRPTSPWRGLGARDRLKPMYDADLVARWFSDGGGLSWNGSENERRRRAGEPCWRKRPAIHMPRWATRLWLEVVDVRVERLDDITEDAARAEGIPASGDVAERMGLFDALGWPPDPANRGIWDATDPVTNYRRLFFAINEIRDEQGVEMNPWLWAVKFRRCDPPKNGGS